MHAIDTTIGTNECTFSGNEQQSVKFFLTVLLLLYLTLLICCKLWRSVLFFYLLGNGQGHGRYQEVYECLEQCSSHKDLPCWWESNTGWHCSLL